MLSVAEKGAIKFLLFSYFGITSEDDSITIIDAAIEKAYRDATNQGAFNTQLENDKKEASSECKKEAETVLKKLVDECFEKTSLEADWHCNACKEICGIYAKKEISKFTYGNAQKWVNMTLKNLYIIGSLHELVDLKDSEKWEKLLEKASEFHAPVDNYILQAVWEDENSTTPDSKKTSLKDCKNLKLRGDGTTYRIVKETDEITWSQIPDEETYKSVKEAIDSCLKENGKLPLDRENEAWLKIAKARKRNS